MAGVARPPSIRAQGLRFAYPPLPGETETLALDGVDFTVEAGEAVAIVGAPGSGKSTLCRALVGLVPHLSGGAFGGRVEILGMDTRRVRPAELAGRTAIVFDDPETQLFCLTVEDEVAFGPESLGLPPDDIRRRVAEALDLAGLDVDLDRSPRELSGGQQQRLALATAIALHPQVLVLDGPTAQLDPRGQIEFHQALARLRREREVAVVFVEHDPELVAEHAGRVLVLAHGRIALDGPPEAVFADPLALARLGVAGPEMSEVAWRIGRLAGSPVQFATVEQAARSLPELLGVACGAAGEPSAAQPSTEQLGS